MGLVGKAWLVLNLLVKTVLLPLFFVKTCLMKFSGFLSGGCEPVDFEDDFLLSPLYKDLLGNIHHED